MQAEQLIALEAAVADLGTLYTVASSFTPLHQQAEAELLPRLSTLGSRLRALLRAAQLTPTEIESAAQEILALRSQWRVELEQVRASPTYQQARAALAEDRQADLARLVPQIFSGLQLASPAPDLFFPVSPSTGRRRPGSSPFLNATECADKIVQLLAEGITPMEPGAEWWERELLSIGCAGTVDTLETPISLQLAASHVAVAVFAIIDEPSFRIFTPRLRAPLSITLARNATDEWWEAFEESYPAFRDALQHELATRGHPVTVVEIPDAERAT